jgi:hypothetical protein
VTAPGAVIALAGGMLAAASLALSGLITWTSSQPGAAADPAAARILATLGFATGAASIALPRTRRAARTHAQAPALSPAGPS